MFARRRRPDTNTGDPDFPISPLIDLSLFVFLYVVFFVLLFFFVVLKYDALDEGQIRLDLSERAADPFPNRSKYVVRVTTTRFGQIANMAVRDENAADWTDLGADPIALVKELKRLYAERIKIAFVYLPPKLTLEIGDELLQAYVIQVLDAAFQAGFTDIALVPIELAER